jgi:hypothetical protein
MPEKTKREKLSALFKNTPEMQECERTAGSIRNNLDMEDTVSITLKVPKEFIRLTEFLEEKRSSGKSPRPPAEVLNQILLNDLHDDLHWLVVSPARFGYYRDHWNKFCDAQGAPEEKIDDGTTTPATGGEEEGPF